MAIGIFQVRREELADLAALAVGLEGLAVGPDLVEDDGVAVALGEGVVDPAGHRIEQAGVFPVGVGPQRRQGAEESLLAAGFGLEAGSAVDLLGHDALPGESPR